MAKVYTNFFVGEGISDKDENGFDVTQNLDVLSNLGTVRCQYALKRENSVVDEPCYQAQDLDGNIYFFSSASSGKIWKRDAVSGDTELVRTNQNGAHFSARYFNGKVTYTNRSSFGSYTVATDTWNDSVGTFLNGAMYHPMEEVNAILHIGDGKDIPSYNAAGNFNQSALDIPPDYVTTALVNENSYLLSGTTVSSTVVTAKAFYWDTYSSSWTIEDELVAVCFFVKCDNDLFMVGRTLQDGSSVIYFWNGNKAERFKTIRNHAANISVQATAQRGDKTLFAVGNALYALYKPLGGSYGLVREYTADSDIQSVFVSGNTLYVSTQTGVYTEDQNTRATGVITAPFHLETFNSVRVPYQRMDGCSLTLETNINDEGWVTETNFVDDTTNSEYVLVNGISSSGEVNFGKVRVTLNPVADLSPSVIAIIVE